MQFRSHTQFNVVVCGHQCVNPACLTGNEKKHTSCLFTLARRTNTLLPETQFHTLPLQSSGRSVFRIAVSQLTGSISARPSKH